MGEPIGERSAMPDAGTRFRILVVEDDPFIA
jgi:hypothetical protein